MYKERKVMTKVDTIAEMSKRYQNGKIYKISSLECDGPCYIGATCTKYLSTRLRKHKEKKGRPQRRPRGRRQESNSGDDPAAERHIMLCYQS